MSRRVRQNFEVGPTQRACEKVWHGEEHQGRLSPQTDPKSVKGQVGKTDLQHRHIRVRQVRTTSSDIVIAPSCSAAACMVGSKGGR